MYTGYIVEAHEIAEDSRVAQAIVNLGLSDEDVICIANDGYVVEIETFSVAKQILADPTIETIEEAMEKLLAQKNGAEPTVDEMKAALMELGVDIHG